MSSKPSRREIRLQMMQKAQLRIQQQLLIAQQVVANPDAFLAERENEKKVTAHRLGALPVIAGIFDYFGLTGFVDSLLPKDADNVVVSNGELLKGMGLQTTGRGIVSLNNAPEFLKNVPLDTFFREGLAPENFNRFALARLLDAVHDYGCRAFFSACSAHIMSRLGQKVTCVHIDTTSVHFHGSPKEEEEGCVAITFGYSRDGHPELPQIVVLGLADHQTGLPVLYKGISGNENDKKAFHHFLEQDIAELIKHHPGVKTIVGDSALCTADIFTAAKQNGLHVVTKMPMTNKIAQQYVKEADISKFTNIYDDTGPGRQERGQWCNDVLVGDVPAKALLVENVACRDATYKKLKKKAKTEQTKVLQDLKKLSSQGRLTSLDEAEQKVAKVQEKYPLCSITDITYKEVWKNARRGRPAANHEAEKKLARIEISATVEINEEAVKETTELSIRYLLVTTDFETPWTMETLLRTYRGQSHIEDSWRLMKDKRIMAESIFVQTPHRIEALMCIFYLFVLLLKVTEKLLREGMARFSYVLPPVANEPAAAKPTISRFIDYVINQDISLFIKPPGEKYININNDLFKIFASMGAHWLRYYLVESYATMQDA